MLVHLGLGLNLSAILWRRFTGPTVSGAVEKVIQNNASFSCQRYGSMHLHSSIYHYRYLALRSLVTRHFTATYSFIYCTKIKLNKNAYLLVFCLSLRIASRCNFNALLLVNLIKCFCSKAISV